MMNSTTNWGVILVGLALAVFLAVLVIIVGGWLFAWAWGSFMVAAFGLPTITTSEGIAAMIMLYVGGWATGLRRGTTTKSD